MADDDQVDADAFGEAADLLDRLADRQLAGGVSLNLGVVKVELTGPARSRPDPVLTLKDGNGVTLATNDDWQSSQAADITATGLAPTNSAESAILTSLPAGNYSGVVSGKGSATGIALVEAFQLP